MWFEDELKQNLISAHPSVHGNFESIFLKMLAAYAPTKKGYVSSFEILLTQNDSNSIHVKNLQKLMTEIYKSMNHLNPSLVWEFHEKKHVMYNLRIQNLCKLPTIKTLNFGLESLSFRGSIL